MGVHYQVQEEYAGAKSEDASYFRSEQRIMDSPEPSPEAVGYVPNSNLVYDGGLVSDWVEVWDYVGGVRFRGFVAEKEGERSLFVFFDQDVIGAKIKAG
jgi:hypothetical protein